MISSTPQISERIPFLYGAGSRKEMGWGRLWLVQYYFARATNFPNNCTFLPSRFQVSPPLAPPPLPPPPPPPPRRVPGELREVRPAGAGVARRPVQPLDHPGAEIVRPPLPVGHDVARGRPGREEGEEGRNTKGVINLSHDYSSTRFPYEYFLFATVPAVNLPYI